MSKANLARSSTCLVALLVVAPLAIPVDARESSKSGIVHPGLLHSQQQLAAFKAAVGDPHSCPVFRAAYLELQRDFRASHQYVPHPVGHVVVSPGEASRREKSFKDDALAAYLNALQWVATGNARHRDKALQILDGWATAYQDITAVHGKEKRQVSLAKVRALELAWVLPIWANGAEIMQHYDNGAAGWKSESVAAFGQFIERLYAERRGIAGDPSNRGVSAALSMMAAGVFRDDRARYQEGRRRIRGFLPTVILPNGEIRELRSRDCHHPQYSLTGFVQAAEIANNQGDESIWMESDGRGLPLLGRGLEYIATALVDGTEARDCRGKKLLPGYASLAIIQARRAGLSIPKFDALARQSGHDGASLQFVGWTAAVRPSEEACAHEPGH